MRGRPTRPRRSNGQPPVRTPGSSGRSRISGRTRAPPRWHSGNVPPDRTPRGGHPNGPASAHRLPPAGDRHSRVAACSPGAFRIDSAGATSTSLGNPTPDAPRPGIVHEPSASVTTGSVCSPLPIEAVHTGDTDLVRVVMVRNLGHVRHSRWFRSGDVGIPTPRAKGAVALAGRGIRGTRSQPCRPMTDPESTPVPHERHIKDARPS